MADSVLLILLASTFCSVHVNLVAATKGLPSTWSGYFLTPASQMADIVQDGQIELKMGPFLEEGKVAERKGKPSATCSWIEVKYADEWIEGFFLFSCWTILFGPIRG